MSWCCDGPWEKEESDDLDGGFIVGWYNAFRILKQRVFALIISVVWVCIDVCEHIPLCFCSVFGSENFKRGSNFLYSVRFIIVLNPTSVQISN